LQNACDTAYSHLVYYLIWLIYSQVQSEKAETASFVCG